MKGIYLTEQSKQEIEAKIAKLELVNKTEIEDKWEVKAGVTFGCILMLNEILSSAIILPVAETWHDIHEEDVANWSETNYSKGVIIQPKQ
jgi:hypothetical protein